MQTKFSAIVKPIPIELNTSYLFKSFDDRIIYEISNPILLG